jgi:hypothetical protein
MSGLVFLRSLCTGIAALIASVFLGLFIGLPIAAYYLSKKFPPTPGGGEVGWDLVTMAHNTSPDFLLLPLLIFAIGFALGFRHFSRPSRRT